MNKEQRKDKIFFRLGFQLVLIFLLILLGALLSLVILNKFIANNDYVLCNVYDLEKANKIIYGDPQGDYITSVKVNFTQGVIQNGYG